jgi:hypothetical protein
MEIKLNMDTIKNQTICRFWDKVDRNCTFQSDRTLTPCWEWIGTKGQRGYGFFKVGGRMLKAHRFAYALCIGNIPDGSKVHHRCHNTACVNPYHLKLETASEHAKNHIASGDMPVGYLGRSYK